MVEELEKSEVIEEKSGADKAFGMFSWALGKGVTTVGAGAGFLAGASSGMPLGFMIGAVATGIAIAATGGLATPLLIGAGAMLGTQVVTGAVGGYAGYVAAEKAKENPEVTGAIIGGVSAGLSSGGTAIGAGVSKGYQAGKLAGAALNPDKEGGKKDLAGAAISAVAGEKAGFITQIAGAIPDKAISSEGEIDKDALKTAAAKAAIEAAKDYMKGNEAIEKGGLLEKIAGAIPDGVVNEEGKVDKEVAGKAAIELVGTAARDYIKSAGDKKGGLLEKIADALPDDLFKDGKLDKDGLKNAATSAVIGALESYVTAAISGAKTPKSLDVNDPKVQNTTGTEADIEEVVGLLKDAKVSGGRDVGADLSAKPTEVAADKGEKELVGAGKER